MNQDNPMMSEYLDIGGKLAQKWDFLVEGIENEFTRTTTAILLENTARKINETTNGLITEGFDSADVTGINRILLPIIRRVYPHMMANEFVTVQPMLTPTAQIFYLRYKYGASATSISGQSTIRRKGETKAGDEFLRVPSHGAFGLNPYYSSQVVDNQPVCNGSDGGTDAGNPVVLNDAGSGTATGITFATEVHKTFTLPLFPVLANTVKVRVLEVELEAVPAIGSQAATTRIIYGDVVATATFANDASSTSGSISATSVDDTLGFFESATLYTYTAAGQGTVHINTLAGATESGKNYVVTVSWEYNLENQTQIPEMKINIETDTLTAKERKLKTEWTQEAMQDLKALHNIDAEAELTGVISSMLIGEIDREILSDLINGAAIRESYDYTADFSNVTARNFLDRNQALAAKIIDMGALIHTYGKLGTANWCVTSPRIAAKLEATRGYNTANEGKHEEYNMGITLAGSINGKQMKVYVDPYFPQNKVLIGYKGNSFLATSYVYAPYQPLYTTPLIYNPTTLTPIRGFLTRYGKKLVIGGEYLLATLTVSNADA